MPLIEKFEEEDFIAIIMPFYEEGNLIRLRFQGTYMIFSKKLQSSKNKKCLNTFYRF
jgi:hypothetical protein